nr:hypothetical protein [Lysobacter enzymogenes]
MIDAIVPGGHSGSRSRPIATVAGAAPSRSSARRAQAPGQELAAALGHGAVELRRQFDAVAREQAVAIRAQVETAGVAGEAAAERLDLDVAGFAQERLPGIGRFGIGGGRRVGGHEREGRERAVRIA